MARPLKQPHNSGFTLLELMLVVSFMGILFGLVIPEYLDYNRRQQILSVTQNVADGIKMSQNLALGGVQSDSDFIASYSFELFNNVGDPANNYRGYRIKRLDESAAEITPTLLEEEFSCNSCILSANNAFSFSVPTAVVGGLGGSSASFSTCYPTIGSYPITIDQAGKIEIGTFSSASCSCGFSC